MKPFRKNIAIAIDGGGMRGVIPIRALMKLESVMGIPLSQMAGLVAGTSTGSIICAGLAAGLGAGLAAGLAAGLVGCCKRRSGAGKQV